MTNFKSFDYDKLSFLIRNSGMKKMEFYKAMEISQPGYDKLINNKRLKVSQLEKLCGLFNVKPSYFFDEKRDDQENHNPEEKHQLEKNDSENEVIKPKIQTNVSFISVSIQDDENQPLFRLGDVIECQKLDTWKEIPPKQKPVVINLVDGRQIIRFWHETENKDEINLRSYTQTTDIIIPIKLIQSVLAIKFITRPV